MRLFLAGVTAAAIVAALATPALAKPETVKGKVVDEGCSANAMEMEKRGDHAGAQAMEECVLRCAKEGEPLALLTADGKVYRIVGGLAANKNAKLIAHVNHTVEITGEIGQQEGKTTIEADSLKMIAAK